MYISNNLQINKMQLKNKPILFGQTKRAEETNSDIVTLSKTQQQQRESLLEYKKAITALENSKKSTAEYFKNKERYDAACEKFLKTYARTIQFAVNRILQNQAHFWSNKVYQYEEDLKIDAQMALLEAGKSFDLEKGDNFHSYAIYNMNWKLIDSIPKYLRPIAISTTTITDTRKALAILWQQNIDIKKASIEEICKITSCSEDTAKLIKNIKSITKVQSLDAPVRSKSSTSIPFVELGLTQAKTSLPINNVIFKEYVNKIKEEIEKEAPEHQKIIYTYIKNKKNTYNSTARILGTSSTKVQRVMNEFIEKLRNILSDNANKKISAIKVTPRTLKIKY